LEGRGKSGTPKEGKIERKGCAGKPDVVFQDERTQSRGSAITDLKDAGTKNMLPIM